MTFVYHHNVSINPPWVPDEETDECYCCLGIFTFSIRRHHCRTCGNVVCDSCSKTKQMVQGNQVRVCRSCNTYLWIKRSGQDIDHIICLMNQCLMNYHLKWQNMKILFNAQANIIPQIQMNQKNGNLNDNDVVYSISNYIMPPHANRSIDLNKVTLHTIESLLECERQSDMIYFVCIPPKHNPKLSPWTRRVLFITKDSKLFMSSPLDPKFALFQFIACTMQSPSISIHFQYYAPLNRLFQQQLVAIDEQFMHIPQFKAMSSCQTLIVFMTKRNLNIAKYKEKKQNAKPRSYSSVIVKETNSNVNHFRTWSYFKDKSDDSVNGNENEDSNENENANGNENTNDNEQLIIDINKTKPTLVLLPFCVQLYHRTYFIVKPPRKPPSAPAPPAPPDIDEIEHKENQKADGIMNRWFKSKNMTKTDSVYGEYIRKLSSFFVEEKLENESNPLSVESDVVLHPQRNMFDDADWRCLEYHNVKETEDEYFEFDAVQDLYDVLNSHRHRYLRSFYKCVVAFHDIMELMMKPVSWNNAEQVRKLEILWNGFVIHVPSYKQSPLRFDEMMSIKHGAHSYWKEIGFQGNDPLTDFRGMGEFALDCLVYFALNYQPHCELIFSKPRKENNYYPLCASFINIVNLISELTNARKVEEHGITEQSSLFKLIILDNEYECAFQELFCLICRVFDNVWRATKSFYWDFPKLYNAFRERIEFMLSKEPKSLRTLIEWLEVDTYIFEYKEADFNEMDNFDSNLILLNGK